MLRKINILSNLKKLAVLPVLVLILFNTLYIVTVAQDSNSDITPEKYKEAQNTISQVLGVQVLCQEPFLNFKATQDCINLEIGGFLPVLEAVDEGLRNQLTPLRDSNKTFFGPMYNQQELEILPIEILSIPSHKPSCQWNYSVLQTVGKPLAKRYTIAFESCGLDISSYQLLEIKNGQPATKLSGKIETRTLLIPLNQTFYLIA